MQMLRDHSILSFCKDYALLEYCLIMGKKKVITFKKYIYIFDKCVTKRFSEINNSMNDIHVC